MGSFWICISVPLRTVLGKNPPEKNHSDPKPNPLPNLTPTLTLTPQN